jgi:hypothetical protein
MTFEFRRICVKCKKPIDWTEGREFFHTDGSPICEPVDVDLELRLSEDK